jgi:hypothetical protein
LAFRRAFGNDLEALDGDWHRFMADLQTPIEQHAPRPDLDPAPRKPGG